MCRAMHNASFVGFHVWWTSMFEVCRHPKRFNSFNFCLERHQRVKITRPSFGGVDHWPQEGYDPKPLLFCEGPLAGITAAGVYKLFQTRTGVPPNGLPHRYLTRPPRDCTEKSSSTVTVPRRVTLSYRVCGKICRAPGHMITWQPPWFHLWTKRREAWSFPRRIMDSAITAGLTRPLVPLAPEVLCSCASDNSLIAT